MSILRDHGGDNNWSPQNGLIGSQVCMHASIGPVRIAQTTGSLICQLSDNSTTVWISATSTPCTAIFKPVWLDAGLPDMGPALEGHFDERALWWRHEAFQRQVQRDYQRRLHCSKATGINSSETSSPEPKRQPTCRRRSVWPCLKIASHEPSWPSTVGTTPCAPGEPSTGLRCTRWPGSSSIGPRACNSAPGHWTGRYSLWPAPDRHSR